MADSDTTEGNGPTTTVSTNARSGSDAAAGVTFDPKGPFNPHTPGMGDKTTTPTAPAVTETPDLKTAERKTDTGVDAAEGAYAYGQHYPEEHREVFAEFVDLAKEAGLPGMLDEKLSKAVMKFGTEAILGEREHHARLYAEQIKTWNAESMTIPEAERAIGTKFLGRLFDKDTIQRMGQLGYLDYKPFVLAMIRGGKAIADDVWINAGGARDERRTDARSHFPNSGHAP